MVQVLIARSEQVPERNYDLTSNLHTQYNLQFSMINFQLVALELSLKIEN